MKRLLLLLPVVCLAQDVIPVVCPDCNVEALEAPWICPRCGKQLEAPAGEPEPDPAPADERPSAPPDAASAVREDVRFAASRAESAPAAALAAVRNALALAAFVPDALSAADRKALVARETALLARLASETAPCPNCGGTGRVAAPRPPVHPSKHGKNYKDIESVAISGLNAKKATKACPLCGGAGKARRAADRKRLAGLVGFGVRDFGTAARAAGREEFRGVWLPEGLAASLSAGSAAPPAPAARPCPECAGTGTQPCRACAGFGRVLCGNVGFHSPPKPPGEGADPISVEASVLAPVSRDPCPVCGGTWDSPRPLPCRDCSGRGVVPCHACSGTGSR